MLDNKLLSDKEYCYHGTTTRLECTCGGFIYKDTKGAAFCLKCKRDFYDGDKVK